MDENIVREDFAKIFVEDPNNYSKVLINLNLDLKSNS